MGDLHSHVSKPPKSNHSYLLAGNAYVGVIEWWIEMKCRTRRKLWPNKSGFC